MMGGLSFRLFSDSPYLTCLTAKMKLTQGVMAAVSAGMLIYAASVEMLAGDFIMDPSLWKSGVGKQALALISLLVGASAMAFIGCVFLAFPTFLPLWPGRIAGADYGDRSFVFGHHSATGGFLLLLFISIDAALDHRPLYHYFVVSALVNAPSSGGY
jgi:hypothetical protein